ncbi:efflux RND transporter permease subunit [Helicobacter burdigaliensis]|uniref:efflux RND transporter permease subunit n=1 Tax=Helicobacter burdigaliensis TaxID=2315334 RepID=UPI000EF68FF1|nr:efflux RND transporter permease subunit [Helicobacter burdigaliensis]
MKELLNRPVVVLVGMILVSLFGILSLSTMPYQLTPKVTRPVISVNTTWSGATPYEVEREIIERQEQVLKGIDNLISLESRSRNGKANVTLEFSIGTDLTKALLGVSNKLDEVKGYPDAMDRPIIKATGDDTAPTIRMMLTSINDSVNVRNARTFFNEKVIQYFERIDGVAEVFFPGGDDREMHVILDYQKLAAYDLTIDTLINALERNNVNIAAGTMNYGRKSYRVRTASEFKTPQSIRETIIWSDGVKRVKVGDIAEVKEGFENKTTSSLYNFKEALNISIKPTADANVLILTNAVEKVFNELNEGILKKEGLKLEWMNDQRDYIEQAISLVKGNILVGAFLACGILFIFLRSLTSTLIIAISMPISIFGTFIVMAALDRTLNVVSLAGISFAVGMLVDSAIVVLENIDRHRKMDKTPLNAVIDGTKEVIGGLIASVLTTVAIFIPIINMQEEAGQLFRDIALAASSAVLFSLFVSIIIIPTLSFQASIYTKKLPKKEIAFFNKISTKLTNFGNLCTFWIMFFVTKSMQNTKNKLLTIFSLTFASFALTFFLFPKMEYLPQGNQNFVFATLNPPPGLSYEERQKIGREIFECLSPYFAQNGFKGEKNIPPIDNMFYLGSETAMHFGMRSTDMQRAGDLIPIAKSCIAKIPSIRGNVSQAGIFERRGGQGRSIDVDISGTDLESIVATTLALQRLIFAKFGEDVQVSPRPSLEILYPELNLYPNYERLSAVGFDATSFGIMLDTLMDGRKISEYKEEGREKIDLILKAKDTEITSPEELYRASIYTPDGGILPISSLALLKLEYGINEIRHLERDRTISLQVNPPKNITIEESMELISTDILKELKESGALGDNKITLGGTADQLTKIKSALEGGFLLAIFIIYLLMAALYEDFIYPLIILFTVPLAVGGGFLGLFLVDTFIIDQPLDILTMLGFIILVGVVVNNAILIVYQSLHNIRLYGFNAHEGILDAVRTRIRPIYMSTLTSLFGMLPLVIAPGAGSEIYRGLGAVILGGLGLSTFLTLFLIPCILSFFIKREKPCA